MSGRHKLADGRYHLVCVAVSAVLSPFDVEKIEDMRIYHEESDDVSVETVAGLVKRAAARYPGAVVTEPGEFYNYPGWRVEAILGRKVQIRGERGRKKGHRGGAPRFAGRAQDAS